MHEEGAITFIAPLIAQGIHPNTGGQFEETRIPILYWKHVYNDLRRYKYISVNYSQICI